MSQERAKSLLDEPMSRGSLKRAGSEIDVDAELRSAVVLEARRRGVDLDEDLIAGPGKRLLRRAREREATSRVRKNPVAVDEGFECAHCARAVPPHGRSARDHCPFCLHGLHVDGAVPGDRSSDCGGLLVPIGADQKNSGWKLLYRCNRCGAKRVLSLIHISEPPRPY